MLFLWHLFCGSHLQIMVSLFSQMTYWAVCIDRTTYDALCVSNLASCLSASHPIYIPCSELRSRVGGHCILAPPLLLRATLLPSIFRYSPVLVCHTSHSVWCKIEPLPDRRPVNKPWYSLLTLCVSLCSLGFIVVVSCATSQLVKSDFHCSNRLFAVHHDAAFYQGKKSDPNSPRCAFVRFPAPSWEKIRVHSFLGLEPVLCGLFIDSPRAPR